MIEVMIPIPTIPIPRRSICFPLLKSIALMNIETAKVPTVGRSVRRIFFLGSSLTVSGSRISIDSVDKIVFTLVFRLNFGYSRVLF